jgi:CheY-like chemotaxis protein
MALKSNRVLFVDDDPVVLGPIAEALKLAGFYVVAASSPHAARQAALNQTFHVALVDIMLHGPQDYSDRQGFDVINFIRDLDEGTLCIAMSGYSGDEVAATAVNLHVNAYIRKRTTPPKDIIATVANVGAACKINHFGSFSNIMEYFCGSEDIHIWENALLHTLGTDAKTFRDLIAQTTSSLTPLLPARNTSSSFQHDPTHASVRGSFWSKAIGSGVSITIGNSSPSSQRATSASLSRHTVKGLAATVRRIDNCNRNEFVEKTSDVHKSTRPRIGG